LTFRLGGFNLAQPLMLTEYSKSAKIRGGASFTELKLRCLAVNVGLRRPVLFVSPAGSQRKIPSSPTTGRSEPILTSKMCFKRSQKDVIIEFSITYQNLPAEFLCFPFDSHQAKSRQTPEPRAFHARFVCFT
jgi:hypothetical protein